MPITTLADEKTLYGDTDHWGHVLNHLFVPAVEKAGFEAIRPSASGTSMIHGRIVQHLIEVDMVLCDLSQHNPNVFFELGVRTSLDKPIALVKDEHLKIPFDTSGLNTHEYSSKLDVWDLPSQIDALATHILDSVRESNGTNPMWQHFGVAIAAARPSEDLSPADARLEILVDRISGLEDRLARRVDLSSVVTPIGEQTQAEAVRDAIADVALSYDWVMSTRVLATKRKGVHSVALETEVSNPEVQRSHMTELSNGLRQAGFELDYIHTGPTEIKLRVAEPF
jgi:hypothetical protein